jgi:hypothetical protein
MEIFAAYPEWMVLVFLIGSFAIFGSEAKNLRTDEHNDLLD